MKIYLGLPRGFCAGVVRAIDIVELALDKFGPPVYVKHQIVHNAFVVTDLEKKGAVTVEDVSDIPVGSTVVFSAHGSPPEDFKKAKEQPDITPLKNAIDALNKKWAEISQNIYNQSEKEGPDNSKGNSQKGNGKDNVEDADFEVVDD